MSAAPAVRVLIVEDDEAIRSLLTIALRREHFEVHTASDGAEALRLVHAFEYAVIVLDLMLPRVNGFEFLERFHASPSRTPSVVIIVITAYDDSVVRMIQPEHAHVIVRKPFDIHHLVDMISEVALHWSHHAAAFNGDPRLPLPEGDGGNSATKPAADD